MHQLAYPDVLNGTYDTPGTVTQYFVFWQLLRDVNASCNQNVIFNASFRTACLACDTHAAAGDFGLLRGSRDYFWTQTGLVNDRPWYKSTSTYGRNLAYVYLAQKQGYGVVDMDAACWPQDVDACTPADLGDAQIVHLENGCALE